MNKFLEQIAYNYLWAKATVCGFAVSSLEVTAFDEKKLQATCYCGFLFNDPNRSYDDFDQMVESEGVNPLANEILSDFGGKSDVFWDTDVHGGSIRRYGSVIKYPDISLEFDLEITDGTLSRIGERCQEVNCPPSWLEWLKGCDGAPLVKVSSARELKKLQRVAKLWSLTGDTNFGRLGYKEALAVVKTLYEDGNSEEVSLEFKALMSAHVRGSFLVEYKAKKGILIDTLAAHSAERAETGWYPIVSVEEILDGMKPIIG